MVSVEVAWAYLSAHVASFASRYPKALAASVSLGLAGFAATAFGVAPQVPDASDLPRRTIIESTAPDNLQAQVDILREQDLEVALQFTNRR